MLDYWETFRDVRIQRRKTWLLDLSLQPYCVECSFAVFVAPATMRPPEARQCNRLWIFRRKPSLHLVCGIAPTRQ
jgi:hypothetical protein